MDLEFEEKIWTAILNDDEPAYLPIPKNCKFSINQIEAIDQNSERISLEMICSVVRADKIDDENDAAVTDIHKVNIATIFPKKSPTQQVNLNFSEYNAVSFRAVGGKLSLSGVYNNSDANEVVQEFNEEEN